MYCIECLYNVLVNRVPGIREKYKKWRMRRTGAGRFVVWLYLLYLNIAYHIFRIRKIGELEKYPYYEEKQLYAKGSESSLSKRDEPEVFAEELAMYDVISFDVFDTLILRPFSSPTDLFYLLGDQLNYMDFQRIRIEMEWKAREKKYKKEKHYEIKLEDIYDILAEETGLDKEASMNAEVELEYQFCFANPYMLKVVKALEELGKRVIITSDMYLSAEQIRTLLNRCGYPEFSSYYVSCENAKSKNKGDLFDYVRKKEGIECTYAHIGDNYTADIEQAKKHGFESYHYVNVNAAGMPYRSEDMSVITGGIYRGLVNAHIHNGLYEFSREYEYGYIYGGLFVTGYCQFIHEYVKQHHVDKILFLARDGDILSKAYKKMYPEEENLEYVYWSRLAATKMSASYYKYDYFRRFLYHKVNQKYTLEKVLEAMELEDMLYGLCHVCGVTADTELTDRNIEKVKRYLQDSWDVVLEHYNEQLSAGKQYYTEVLKGCKNVVAVDIGWAGSGAITLDYIVNHIWNLNCKVTGIVAGTNSCHNAEPDTSETFLQSGKLVSYMYSQRENRDLWKFHDPGKGHNLYWEMLLDAPMGSFKGFYLNKKGEHECLFREITHNVHEIDEIHAGILEFVREWHQLKQSGNPDFIAGRDAYAPMLIVKKGENSQFIRNLIKLKDTVNVD